MFISMLGELDRTGFEGSTLGWAEVLLADSVRLEPSQGARSVRPLSVGKVGKQTVEASQSSLELVELGAGRLTPLPQSTPECGRALTKAQMDLIESKPEILQGADLLEPIELLGRVSAMAARGAVIGP